MDFKLKSKIVEKYGVQWRFAVALGVDDSIVSKVICGRKELDTSEKKRWAETLGCQSRDIFRD